MDVKMIMDAHLLSIEKRQLRLKELDAERVQQRKEMEALELAIIVLKADWADEDWDEVCAVEAPPIDPYSEYVASDDENVPISHQVRRAVYKVLLEERPLHRNTLLTRVGEQGVEILGHRPTDSLTGYIGSDARFQPFPGMRGYWTLTQEPTGKRPIAPASEVE